MQALVFPSFLRNHWQTALWILGFVVINWYVYSPALHRLFAADQVVYLAELRGSDSLADGLRQYDYSNSRRFLKGDEITFRPLLFVWLAIQNSLFSYHYVYWNLTQLGLHLVVVLLLFGFLLRLQSREIAALFTLLFSVMTPPLELVVWNHLGGYLWAFALFLVGLGAAQRMVASEDSGRAKWAVLGCAALTLGSFFYELIIPFSWAIGGFVLHAFSRKKQKAPLWLWLLLALPTLLYGAGYLVHWQNAHRLLYLGDYRKGSFWQSGNLLLLPQRSLSTLAQWMLESSVPTCLAWTTPEFERLFRYISAQNQLLPILFNLGILSLFLGFVVKATPWRRLQEQLPLIVLLTTCVLLYIAAYGLGRPLTNSYHDYFFCLAIVILACAVPRWSAMSQLQTILITLTLVSLIALHAFLTHEVCNAIANENAMADRCHQTISSFVDQHRNEESFSFGIRNLPPYVDHNAIDPFVSFVEGFPDDPLAPRRKLRISEILYARYYNDHNPKYWLDFGPKPGP